MALTEYSGAGPSCSVDSRFGSFPPRNNEISSDVDRLKQLPILCVCLWIAVIFNRTFTIIKVI